MRTDEDNYHVHAPVEKSNEFVGDVEFKASAKNKTTPFEVEFVKIEPLEETLKAVLEVKEEKPVPKVVLQHLSAEIIAQWATRTTALDVTRRTDITQLPELTVSLSRLTQATIDLCTKRKYGKKPKECTK